MRTSLCLAASLLALNLIPVYGQPGGVPPTQSPNFQTRLNALQMRANAAEAPVLAKFKLDFPGGTPKELVAALEIALGKPLNVIIPEDAAATKLPPFKVSDMDVVKLFKTLSENGKKYFPGTGRGNEYLSNYGFQTLDETPSDTSLWTFYAYLSPEVKAQFSLDFPGGTPAQLVKAIEKATGRPLNVIILAEDADTQLPPIKMDNVDVPHLFATLGAASKKTVLLPNVGPNFSAGQSYRTAEMSYGFNVSVDSTIRPPGVASAADTVWFFHVEKPTAPPAVVPEKMTSYFALSPYLDRGFTVDDITTAIQTGWKMSGQTVLPELNYHKETRLLIAYGEPRKIAMISEVLQTLPPTQSSYPDINARVWDLKKQVEELKKHLPPPAPAAVNTITIPVGTPGQ